MFLVPTDTPGIEIRPIFTFQDERTNTTFYTDVRLPDHYRLGEVNGGTQVLGAALQLEQGGGSYVPVQAKMLDRSEEHTSELQSLMRISYAVFCLKKKT